MNDRFVRVERVVPLKEREQQPEQRMRQSFACFFTQKPIFLPSSPCRRCGPKRVCGWFSPGVTCNTIVRSWIMTTMKKFSDNLSWNKYDCRTPHRGRGNGAHEREFFIFWRMRAETNVFFWLSELRCRTSTIRHDIRTYDGPWQTDVTATQKHGPFRRRFHGRSVNPTTSRPWRSQKPQTQNGARRLPPT